MMLKIKFLFKKSPITKSVYLLVVIFFFFIVNFVGDGVASNSVWASLIQQQMDNEAREVAVEQENN